jgi:hypothetical protein
MNQYAERTRPVLVRLDPLGLQLRNPNTYTYAEIREYAIKQMGKDRSAPDGLADAKTSIAVACAARDCSAQDGSNASAPDDQAAWNNITNAEGGHDRTGGGTFMCVGTQHCWWVHSCYACQGSKKVKVPRNPPLPPSGSVTLGGGNTLYFYNDPLDGWCNERDRNCGCKCVKKKHKK